jgi:hypothetical protein
MQGLEVAARWAIRWRDHEVADDGERTLRVRLVHDRLRRFPSILAIRERPDRQEAELEEPVLHRPHDKSRPGLRAITSAIRRAESRNLASSEKALARQLT